MRFLIKSLVEVGGYLAIISYHSGFLFNNPDFNCADARCKTLAASV